MTAVEFTIEKYEKFINSENGSGERYFYDELVKDIEQAKEMEHEQAKRVALHFIVLGGQECGCNWNEINFTDEINKLINE